MCIVLVIKKQCNLLLCRRFVLNSCKICLFLLSSTVSWLSWKVCAVNCRFVWSDSFSNVFRSVGEGYYPPLIMKEGQCPPNLDFIYKLANTLGNFSSLYLLTLPVDVGNNSKTTHLNIYIFLLGSDRIIYLKSDSHAIFVFWLCNFHTICIKT